MVGCCCLTWLPYASILELSQLSQPAFNKVLKSLWWMLGWASWTCDDEKSCFGRSTGTVALLARIPCKRCIPMCEMAIQVEGSPLCLVFVHATTCYLSYGMLHHSFDDWLQPAVAWTMPYHPICKCMWPPFYLKCCFPEGICEFIKCTECCVHRDIMYVLWENYARIAGNDWQKGSKQICCNLLQTTSGSICYLQTAYPGLLDLVLLPHPFVAVYNVAWMPADCIWSFGWIGRGL